jgi:hypothetical protein
LPEITIPASPHHIIKRGINRTDTFLPTIINVWEEIRQATQRGRLMGQVKSSEIVGVGDYVTLMDEARRGPKKIVATTIEEIIRPHFPAHRETVSR